VGKVDALRTETQAALESPVGLGGAAVYDEFHSAEVTTFP